MSEYRQSPGGRSWRERLCRPGNIWLLGIPAAVYLIFFAGALTVIGAEVMIHATDTERFCATACHSMAVFTTPEWLDSPHNHNASGVRATCADCHIPRTYPRKLIVKARSGISDIYHELVGTIDTREKYEAHRARMAEDIWAEMVENDSRECRNCHSEENFVLEEQEEEAAKAHVTGPEEGKTCIDCHKGIAHRTPDEIAEEQQDGEAPQAPNTQQ